MRKIISYFIKYHVAVNVMILAFVIFGVVGMFSLQSSYFPLIESEIITINVTYPGAAPEEIEEGIVLKIEDNLKGLVGVERVTSTSRENGGSITVEIETDEDIDVMLTEVKNAVDRVPNFPSGMEPLVVAKQENIRETFDYFVSGEDVDLATLKQIARQMEYDLRAMDGLSQIEIEGYPEEEIEIAVDENNLLAYNLTFAEVAEAVSRANILTTGGSIKTEAEDFLIRADNRSYYGKELNNLVVKSQPDGTLVTLRDVATIRDRFSETPNASYINGRVAVSVNISTTNNEDLMAAAEKVRQYVKEFNEKNDTIEIIVEDDRSITLSQRTDLLIENGTVGILLVLVFLSLFLNTRLAFWVAFGLPISFLGMFIFASAFGVTINVLSLFGMIIVIGILVDDGIVISENIYQHYEMGKKPVQAAIDGTMEVLPPIISAIITTVLAFSTFLFLDSRIGKFFGEVSIVVILTLVVSLIEALIILPAHIAHSKALVRDNEADKTKKSGLDRFFKKLRGLNVYGDRVMVFLRDKFYEPVVRFTVKNRFISFAIITAMLILTIGSIKGGVVKVTLFPSIASDRVSIDLLMPEGTNPKKTDSIISMVEDAAMRVNEDFSARQSGNKQVVRNIVRRVGPGNNKASLRVNLLPGEERDFGSPEITNAIREEVGEVYGVERLTFGSGGNFGGKPVSVSLLGNNLNELERAKEELTAVLEDSSSLKDVTDTDPLGIKEISIDLKDEAYALGLSLGEVMSQVRAGFFGLQAQRFQRGQDEIKVWVRYDRENRESINDLDDMRIVTPTGDRVPFGEIASYTIQRGTESISHLDGLREIRVEADMEDPNASATDAIANIDDNILPSILSKYPSVSVSYEGQNREADKLTDSAKKVLPVVLFLIYAVIAFTFRSYSQPLLLMLLIPFSIIGVAWGHYLHGFPVNILSLLGVIALVGIMVNDGLVLIGKFNAYLREGMSFDNALIEAGKSRFRAIFLTSLTTIAGIAPLLLERSRQAQFLKPMAISIAYGIFIATFLTLLFLPLLLSITNSAKTKYKWLVTGEHVNKESVERAIKEQNEEIQRQEEIDEAKSKAEQEKNQLQYLDK
ncbi:cation/multidrug efflux protein, AcrB family [Psychroflexus torquis ATCC 700755]|uniref:Cation/multidrug efflux protein, AcrB family n=1 Tax=Psychroflexus torquis (strain ATCC 700755 / CIP 106069 / ACAM 623) TaxID=313595 RepID=K4IBG0_PSYTT|nr:efflux RND transporter permease subunit [Psychroflexus torquis]AFU67937.1 cation/multidrug efflux protein, AcrB family [Psychroflexus torquis ATCC 700755]